MTALKDTRYVIDKLAWMRSQVIWPNGLRYLWTDAFGEYVREAITHVMACSSHFPGYLLRA